MTTAIELFKKILLSNIYTYKTIKFDFYPNKLEMDEEGEKEYYKFIFIKWYFFDILPSIDAHKNKNNNYNLENIINLTKKFFVENNYLSEEEIEEIIEFLIENNILKTDKNSIIDWRINKYSLKIELENIDVIINYSKNIFKIYKNYLNKFLRWKIQGIIAETYKNNAKNEIIEYLKNNNLNFLIKYINKLRSRKLIDLIKKIINVEPWKIYLVFCENWECSFYWIKKYFLYIRKLKHLCPFCPLRWKEIKHLCPCWRNEKKFFLDILFFIDNETSLKEKIFNNEKSYKNPKYNFKKTYYRIDFLQEFFEKPICQEDSLITSFIKYDFSSRFAKYIFNFQSLNLLNNFKKIFDYNNEKYDQNNFIKKNWENWDDKVKNDILKITNFKLDYLSTEFENEDFKYLKNKQNLNLQQEKLLIKKILEKLEETKEQIDIFDLLKLLNIKVDSDKKIRNIESRVLREENIICSIKRKIRYYEWEKIDRKNILEIINILNNSEPGFYSTKFFFNKNLNLMNELKLIDHYEFHNFLKHFAYEFNFLKLERMPGILIKIENKNEFLEKIIKTNNFVNENDFFIFLENNYGHNINSFKSGFNFKKFINNEFQENDMDIKKEINTILELNGIYKNELKNKYVNKNIESLLSNELKREKLIQTSENCVMTFKYFFDKTNINLSEIEEKIKMYFNENIEKINYFLFDNTLKEKLNLNNELTDYLDEKFILKFITRKVSYLKYEKFSNNYFVIRNKKLESLKDFVKNEIESEKVITFEKLKEKIFQKTKMNLENNFLEKIILKNLPWSTFVIDEDNKMCFYNKDQQIKWLKEKYFN